MKKQLLISIATIITLIPLSGASSIIEQGEFIHTASLDHLVEEGRPAPNISLQTTTGEHIRLSDFKGQKVVVNFWASWCPPCREEMQAFENYFSSNKQNARLMSVNMTNAEKTVNDVQAFLKRNELTFPVLLDNQGKTGEAYQILTLPTSLFIDSGGIIQKKWIGPLDEETIHSILANMN
ncbi:peroxiredoxin family protein [Pradoshia sp.]